MSALLAKVLNSSVGTSTLKPLDKLLETVANNAADKLFNSLKNSVTVISSDETMLSYNGAWENAAASGSFIGYQTTNYIKFDCNGVVRLKTVQKGNRTDYNHTYDIYVYDETGATVATTSMGIAYGATAEISVDFNVSSSKKYKVKIMCYNTGSPTKNITFNGRPILFSAGAIVTT